MAATSHVWPSPYYATRPHEFAHNILGVDTWEFQDDVVETVKRSRKTSVAGGRKIGKDFAGAIVCLWFWACFVGAKVPIYGPKLESIDEILYLEIRGLWRNHGKCIACKKAEKETGVEGPRPCPHSAVMQGDLGVSCKTGLRADDDRAIMGFVANPGGGGLRGLSGEYMLAVVDEACEVPDAHIDVIEGNLASAHAKFLMLMNPTKSNGAGWRSFHTETAAYVRDDGRSSCISRSSEDNPNITRNAQIPGLASKEWLEERRRVWGKDSRLYKTDVLGEWPTAEEGQLFSLHVILERELAHAAADAPAPEGRLSIGVDCAGEGHGGDATAAAVRRGCRILEKVWTKRDCTVEEAFLQVFALIAKYRLPSDVDQNRPVVTVDRDGKIGARFYDYFLAKAQNEYGLMLVRGFRGSEKPQGQAGLSYVLNRDYLFGTLVEWVHEGGCWPEDLKLRAQLEALRWVDPDGTRQVLISKDELRKILKYSPDEMDAIALSCWLMGRVVLPTTAPRPELPQPYSPGRGSSSARAYLGQGYGVQRRGPR